MAQKKLLFILILAFRLISSAKAEDDFEVEEGMFELKKEDIEFARDSAKRARQMNMLAIKEKLQELKEMRKSDLTSKDNDISEIDSLNISNNNTLKIFVSSSMGRELLANYVRQSADYRAVLIFNGLPNGSWLKLSELVRDITKDAADENIAIQIDDVAFSEYGITSVPSFVLVKEENIFEADEEMREERKDGVAREKEDATKFDKIVGNIGIRRALEEIVEQGELSVAAARLLESRGR